VFGEDKQRALDGLFEEGAEEEIPARFFKRHEIAEKTLFITDQAA
jgi:6-phosphogluconolactonase/glucosamine-6-phosphate isomerase/deaminase